KTSRTRLMRDFIRLEAQWPGSQQGGTHGIAWASLWKLVRQQPVYCQGVIQAIIALAVSFGLSLSIEQVGSLTAVTAAVLAFVTQTQVTPIVNPRDAGCSVRKLPVRR